MKLSTRLLCLLLAVVIGCGGYFLSSFMSPQKDYEKKAEVKQAEKMKAPVIRDSKPEPTPEPTPGPTEEPTPETTPEPEETGEPEPAPESTPEPTEEPAPEPTPEPTPEPLLEASYFDDAAFLGDSISGVLEYYGVNNDGLGKATFLVQVDYSVKAAVDNSMFVLYKGRNMSPQDALAAAGVNKVYIMLGAMGDLGNYGLEKTMENYAKLIANIREKNPDIRIFIQSCTPLAADTNKLTNQMIDDYNDSLKTFAEENDCTFVEIGEHFKDESGYLPFKHCRDGFAHLRIDSALLWVELLKDPANYSISPFET